MIIFTLGIVIKCNGYEARHVSLLFFALVFVRSLWTQWQCTTLNSIDSSSFSTREQANSLLTELQRPLFPAIERGVGGGGRKMGLFFSHPLNAREKRFLLAGRTGSRNAPLIYSGTMSGPKTNTIRELLTQPQHHCFHLNFFAAFTNSLSWQLTRLLSKTIQVSITNF